MNNTTPTNTTLTNTTPTNTTLNIVHTMRRAPINDVRRHHYWAKHWIATNQSDCMTRRIFNATAYVLRQRGAL